MIRHLFFIFIEGEWGWRGDILKTQLPPAVWSGPWSYVSAASGRAAPGKFEAEKFASTAQEWLLNPLTRSVVLPRTLRILLKVRRRVSARRGHARHHQKTSSRWPSNVVHVGSCCPCQPSSPRTHGGQATARAGCVGKQHEQSSEATGAWADCQ